MCIAAAVMVSVFLMAMQPVRTPDVWHHVGAGRLVYRNRGPAETDVFSCTAQGKRWVQYEWLAQLLMYGAHEAGGVTGLMLFRAAGVSAAAFLLLLACRARGAGRTAAGVAVLLAMCAGSGRFFSRPEIFTLVIISAWLLWMERLRRGRHGFAAAPALLMIPWVNMHGAWVAGLAVLGLTCAGETVPFLLRRKGAAARRTLGFLWLALGLAAATTLLNPYGWHIWEVPFKLSGSQEVTQKILEWQRPGLADWLDPRHIGALVFLVSLVIAPKGVSLADLFIVAFFGALSLTARRHLALAVLVTAPIAARQFSLIGGRLSERWRQRLSRVPVRIGLVGLVCVATVFCALGGLGLSRAVWGLKENIYPIAAGDFLETHDLKGNLFNSYTFGNYLLYRRHPDNLVFIDGRVDMYGGDLARLYEHVWQARPGWRETLEKYDVDIAVLEISKGGHIPILSALHDSGDWALVFWDNISAVYVRRTPERRAFLDRMHVYAVLPNEVSYDLMGSEQDLARAAADYRRKLEEDPECLLALKGLAECRLRAGAREKAVRLIRRAIALRPESADLHYNLAATLLEMHRLDEAETHLRETIRLGEYQAKAWLALGFIADQRGDSAEALRCFQRALRHDPDNWKAYWNLSQLHEKRNDFVAAARAMEQVIRLRPDDTSARERLAHLRRRQSP